MLRHRTKLDLV